MSDAFKNARTIAVTLLSLAPQRTHAVIQDCVAEAARITRKSIGSEVDEELLVAQLMHEANVLVPDAMMMEDPSDHIEWLPARRGTVNWDFWKRYEQFIVSEKAFPESVVRALDTLTDDILGRLESPERQAPWDCRGMVVGSVQSGKTANYCGLICKAIDAGYKLIVVLAGMHNNLRSQTQYRLDEGVLGRDSQKERHLDQSNSLIGVGKLFGQLLPVHTLTSSLDNGDFRRPKADTGVTIGGDPVILVVKKNGSVLRNLQQWVLHVRGEEIEGEERKVVRNVPLLVIDDEADNASINTKEKKGKAVTEKDVTAINGRIRELLDAFDKSAYIGYTATPFANIFINPEGETPKHGEDLFPRSFILNVSPPSTYVSPSRVFGVDGDPDAGIEPHDPLPLLRIVTDYETVFPQKHKKDLPVQELPPSLREAILCFVLTCAARRSRGQADVHNSMLVHVTRFIDVQHKVAELIQQEVQYIRRRLELGEGERAGTLLDELKSLWLRDFVQTTHQIHSMLPDERLPDLAWNDVSSELAEAAGRIEVREINGYAKEALDYVAHREGFSVISVGGDKLSRGLTLEGLSVSYFLRASKMYDTLMQMGRWFGYRPGYLDLCRLYTTEELSKWYRHIAMAEIELRREFDRMKVAGLTPLQYGLRVREFPGSLLITAMNKMTHARTQRLSYAGQLVQSAHFSTDGKVMAENKAICERFVQMMQTIHSAESHGYGYIWEGVKPDLIINVLLRDMSIATESWRFQKSEVMEFIGRQSEIGELTSWTVVLVNTKSACDPVSVSGLEVQPAERQAQDSWENGVPTLFSTRNSNIQSPHHQALDLHRMRITEEILNDVLGKRSIEDGGPLFLPIEEDCIRQCAEAGESLGKAAEEITMLRRGGVLESGSKSVVNGLVARQLRPRSHGLLLVYPLLPKGESESFPDCPFFGVVLSFPSSHTARSVSYKVGKLWKATFEDDDYADGD